MAWKTSWCITWNAFSFRRILLNVQKFLVVSDCIFAKICLNDVLLRKVMTGVALNAFPNVLLLIVNICQCLLMISLIFGKVGLYVTENGITFFRTASVLFKRADLSKLSTFSIWFRMTFSFYTFSSILWTKSLECFLYSSKVEQTRFILNGWL